MRVSQQTFQLQLSTENRRYNTIGRMTYCFGFGSAPLSPDHGVKQYNMPALVYEDIDFRDQDEEKHVTPSPPATASGGLLVNRRSWSIEKRRRKNKQLYKSDVVMQMWQKVFNESK